MSEVPEMRGERVLLRGLRPSDRDARRALGRDAEFIRLNGGDPRGAGRPFSDEDAERWYAARPDSLRWGIEWDGGLVGEVRLDRLDAGNRSARLAIGVYSSRHRDRGLGSEATRLVLAHAFEVLGLHRVDLNVLEVNERAIHVYERLGFRREGVLRETTLVAGQWLSDVRMSMLKSEYLAAR